MNSIRNELTDKVIVEGMASLKTLSQDNRNKLRYIDLQAANLQGADLQGANLRGADLQGANLRAADLRYADLQGADLRGANLRGADLWYADLRYADLRGANLRGADLRDADLQGADLQGADLQGADLQGANLQGAKIEFWQFPSIRLLSSINLGILSDELTTELVWRDMEAHPKPELFKKWAINQGLCPYQNEERFWFFKLRKECWKPGKPEMRDSDLILAICKEKGWKIKGYLK